MTQILLTAFSIEIQEWAILSKVESIIKYSVVFQHQKAIEDKEAKKMWEIL